MEAGGIEYPRDVSYATTKALGEEPSAEPPSAASLWAPATIAGLGFLFFAAWVLIDPRGPRKNPRGQRRTTARRRKKGRPSGKSVTEALVVRMPYGLVDVDVDRGTVMVDGTALGTVYDLGTIFRSIPYGGDVRSFTTLAGAVKNVIRSAERSSA